MGKDGIVRLQIELTVDEYAKIYLKKIKLNKSWKEILFEWYRMTEAENNEVKS